MEKNKPRRFMIRILLAFVMASNLNIISAGQITLSDQPVAKAASGKTQTPFTLHGKVTDALGNPIQESIYVTDRENNPLANLLTNADGTYSTTIPDQFPIIVDVFLIGSPENYITLPDGNRIKKYFELTRGVIPDSDSVEVNFDLPSSGVLQLEAYDPSGALMNYDALNNAINPPEYYGYDGIYGIFPMSSIALPVPEEASTGQIRWASPLDNNRSMWEPCFSAPVNEASYLMMLWQVPGIGTFPLRADNQGQGYTLANGEIQKINVVYEFAETEHRRALELKTRLEGEGHTFSIGLLDILSQADAALLQARGLSDAQAKALSSYPVLKLSIQAKEMMTMEAAEADIPNRKEPFKVVVQDQAGSPVPGAAVTYHQDKLDFVLTYGQSAPPNPFPYPSYRAGVDIGYQSIYLDPILWKKVSPQEGVFDFSEADAGYNQYKDMGYDITVIIAWLGTDNVPAWAQNLPFTEFQQQVGEFVKRAVEHFSGRTKYMVVAPEMNLQTIGGSRYVSAAYPSNYLTGIQPAELIELIRTAFQAGREAQTDILLGYYGVADFNYSSLNPLPWGAWPTSYTFLKSLLESGVQPDFIGVELYPGTLSIPLDLSNVAGILQAYHDLSGLPVLVTETIAYSSRMGDYGETGPTPQIYWHEGFTQAAQAEWDTSFFKIAMSLPYMLGVQMFHGFPDDPSQANGQTWGDCTGAIACIGHGTDTLTQDFQPKQDYYAMQNLIASWKTDGNGMTDANGEVNFSGMSGTYTIGITTPEGLFQSFECQFDQAAQVVTVKLNGAQALQDLQQRLVEAQKSINWSSQLGRLLDYSHLRSQLATAQNAIAGGNYTSARNLIDQVLAAAAITIDGSPAEWQGIQPILTAPPGGVSVNTPGIDLKALYGVRDDQYLYLLVVVYDPPVASQIAPINGGFWEPQFLFNLQTGPDRWYHMRIYLPYHGQINLYDLTAPAKFIGTYYSIALGNALELKIPLALIGNPASLSACAFVMAGENEAEKVAKAFDGCAEVLHSLPMIFLPLVKR